MQYMIQVYLPSLMFVVVSWVSFTIKPEVVPGRMALLVTLFIVLINIFNSVRYDTGLGKRVVPRLRELAPARPEGARRRDSRNLGSTL